MTSEKKPDLVERRLAGTLCATHGCLEFRSNHCLKHSQRAVVEPAVVPAAGAQIPLDLTAPTKEDT